MRKNIKILTDSNCFVVFPTTKEENIKKLATKYNIKTKSVHQLDKFYLS